MKRPPENVIEEAVVYFWDTFAHPYEEDNWNSSKDEQWDFNVYYKDFHPMEGAPDYKNAEDWALAVYPVVQHEGEPYPVTDTTRVYSVTQEDLLRYKPEVDPVADAEANDPEKPEGAPIVIQEDQVTLDNMKSAEVNLYGMFKQKEDPNCLSLNRPKGYSGDPHELSLMVKMYSEKDYEGDWEPSFELDIEYSPKNMEQLEILASDIVTVLERALSKDQVGSEVWIET